LVVERGGERMQLQWGFYNHIFSINNVNVLLCRGHVQQIGTAAEIQQTPATPFVASFIEDTNKLPATCQVILPTQIPFESGKINEFCIVRCLEINFRT